MITSRSLQAGQKKWFTFMTLFIMGLTTVFVTTTEAAAAPPPTTPSPTPTTYKPKTPPILPFTIPPGIFSTHPQLNDPPVPAATGGDVTYDDFDIYVPYRSDELDQFSWSLLKAVLKETPENVIISPFSMKLVLALLSEAAGNNTQTQKELFATLTDIKTLDNLRGFYKKILVLLKKETPYHTLNLATKLYTDNFIEPQQRYAAILQTFYDTEIERLQFADSQKAADTINQWCSNVTHGRLQQIVSADKVQSSVMLLTNAIYFNGLWRREFNFTFDSEFFTLESPKRVEYMEVTDYFYFYHSKSIDAKILRLPYKGNKFSMFVLLPNAFKGIESLVKNLENDQLKNMQWMMEDMKVKVTMPKFKFEFQKDFKSTLNQLGIHDIFTDEASLPGLARGADVAHKLKVSNIFQKAGIDVNERGTEAYASTVVEIQNKFGGSTSIEEFNVNRPFIFFIEEESTGNIIFAGKVLDPIKN